MMQVFMVMSVTMIFRISNETLSSETIKLLGRSADHKFYATILEILLVSTLVPIVAVLAMPNRVERAQSRIFTLAKTGAATLAKTATTEQARERIRAAVGKVAHRASVSNVFASLGAQASAGPPTMALIFQQIDERGGEPTGKLKPGALVAWWVTAEPAQFTGDGQKTTPYSRANTLRRALAEMELQPNDKLDYDDVTMLLECVMEDEHETVSDASIGKS